MQWKPIATAPKQFWPRISFYNHHAPTLWLWCGPLYGMQKGIWGASSGFVNEGRWEFAGRNVPIPKDHQPTHWMYEHEVPPPDGVDARWLREEIENDKRRLENQT